MNAFPWAVALTISGCTGAPDVARTPSAVVSQGLVDPTFYAGDVSFKITEAFAVGERDVPLTLFLGLSSQTETRLAVEAFVDLRPLQEALPEIVSGSVEPSCSLGIDIDLDHAEAEGRTVRAWGTAQARLYRCPGRGTEGERRGARLLTQNIGFIAVASAELEQDCVFFRLVDLDLTPNGLIGRIVSLLGVTDRVRAAILERGAARLSENPICPELPDELSLFDPRYSEGGLREIGDGGMGAALSGSVDTSAVTLIGLLSLMKARGAVGEAR